MYDHQLLQHLNSELVKGPEHLWKALALQSCNPIFKHCMSHTLILHLLYSSHQPPIFFKLLSCQDRSCSLILRLLHNGHQPSISFKLLSYQDHRIPLKRYQRHLTLGLFIMHMAQAYFNHNYRHLHRHIFKQTLITNSFRLSPLFIRGCPTPHRHGLQPSHIIRPRLEQLYTKLLQFLRRLYGFPITIPQHIKYLHGNFSCREFSTTSQRTYS
jgi:hypothetical protein